MWWCSIFDRTGFGKVEMDMEVFVFTVKVALC